jgi:FemAB-related protein (PEP-CTERM system-associated)
MEIRQLVDRDDYPRWDAFVSGCEEATFFHLAGWRDVIGETFRQPTYFLFAERSGEIAGVLPLAHLRSRLFGERLISLPFCVYGGVATKDDEARRALVARAGELARQLRVEFLELRNRRVQQDLPASDRYVTFRKTLDPDPQRNMNAIPRKQRAMIRKGVAKGLACSINAGVADFYRVYAESLRDLGTPVLPRRYFEALRRVFGDACEIATVRTGQGNRPIAAVMSFYFRDEVLPYYGGGTRTAREFHAYDFMYWQLLVHALGRGARIFDFGRSRQGTGSFRFKTHWGFEPVPLPYQYDLVRAEGMPNVTPDNPRYHALIRLWQRLPVRATTLIGPWLARNLG